MRLIAKLATLIGVGSVASCVAFASTVYSPQYFRGDVTAQAWPAITGLRAVVTNGGSYAAGTRTNYYRVSATNIHGRTAASTNLVVAFTSTASVSNKVNVYWPEYYGAAKYVVQVSWDAGGTWTNWSAVAVTSTNLADNGAVSWSTSALPALISSPTWDMTNAASVKVPVGVDADDAAQYSQVTCSTGTVLVLATNLADIAAAARDVALTNAYDAVATGKFLQVESDPVFSTSAVGSVTSTDTSHWSTAYGWGDHSTNGYLTTESDPVYATNIVDQTNAAVQAANARTTDATNAILSGSTFSGDVNVGTNWHLDSDSGTDSYVLGILGVGTNDPVQRLSVRGNIQYGNPVDGYGRLFLYQKVARSYPSTVMVGVDDGSLNELNFGGGSVIGYATKKINFHTATNDTTTGNSIRLTIASDGKVGIGTNTPTTTLDVNGAATVRGDLDVSTNVHLDSSAGSDSYVLGMLGIGTNNPSFALDVLGTSRFTGDWTTYGNVEIYGDDYPLTIAGRIYSVGTGMGPTMLELWRDAEDNSYMDVYSAPTNGSAPFYGSEIGAHVDGGTTNTSYFAGRVAIGTNVAATTLDVNGGATIRGNITGNGSTIVSNVAQVVINDTNVMAELGTKIEDGQTLSTGLYGPMPSVTNQYATKQYVDDGDTRESTWFFYGAVTSTIPTYYYLDTLVSTNTKTTLNFAGVTNNQYLIAFASAEGEPGITQFSAGTYRIHIHMKKGAAGAATVRPEIYLRNAGGTEYYEFDDYVESTPALTTTETHYDVYLTVPTNQPMAVTDRIVVKLKATVSSGSPTLTLYTDGTTASFFSGNIGGGGGEIDPVWEAAKAGYVATNETSPVSLTGGTSISNLTVTGRLIHDIGSTAWANVLTNIGNDVEAFAAYNAKDKIINAMGTDNTDHGLWWLGASNAAKKVQWSAGTGNKNYAIYDTGIGTNNPAAKLHVNGSSFIVGTSSNSGVRLMPNGGIFTNGAALVTGGGSGGGNQTPWTNNVDAAGYSLTGANALTATNGTLAFTIPMGARIRWSLNTSNYVDMLAPNVTFFHFVSVSNNAATTNIMQIR